MKILKKIMKDKLTIFIISIVIIAFCYIYINNRNLSDKELEIFSNIDNSIDQNTITDNKNALDNNNEKNSEKENNENSIKEGEICVYITGEIKNVGVYYLNEQSRIIDVINMAGGTTENADLSKINLAYILEDGMKVYIPNINDLNNNKELDVITKSPGTDIDDNESQNKDIIKDNNNSINTKKENNQVNINTATQTELETLPGIGPSLALRIIEYRKENGKFNSIEDIKNVTGIGDKKYEDLKNLIKIK